jgi:hypothetical protein
MNTQPLLGQMSHLSIDEKATNAETLVHIHNVNQLLHQVSINLLRRAENHDKTKLGGMELSTFVEYTPKLKTMEYNSDEYKECLKNMAPALDNHYKNNSHHPEHFENGIDGMSLLDILEMVIDWKAATLRTKNGDILKSLEIQKERFNISDQLYDIILNTINELELNK